MSYGSLPFVAPGKLSGLTFKTQFYNAMQNQPDYLFISSFNEYIAQPQPNPFIGHTNTAFNMGLPNDPLATGLYVDSYAWEFSRDIEPNDKYGSYIYDIMSSCVNLYKSGVTKCSNLSEICCQNSNFFTNIYSMQTTSRAFVDYLLSTSAAEVQELIDKGTYSQICTPYGGTTVFCTEMIAEAQSGPFILYSDNIYGDLIGLYRCLEGTSSRHFFSPDPKCEGYTTESMLGYISPIRGRETFRAIYRCLDHNNSAHYHSLDLDCLPQDADEGLLGYVR